MFKAEGLDITIVANLKVMNFLDVEVDLNTGTYRPYTKPNNTLLYIDVNSNHPPSTLKNTAQAVENRLSMLSSSKEIFDQAAPPYQTALNNAGYKHTLKFTKPTENPRRKSNRRKQIWFNPPWSQNVKTNVGGLVLKAVDECFPVGHILRPILNRHTVKVSYRTMPNMAQIIARHNAQTMKKHQPAPICRLRLLDAVLSSGLCGKEGALPPMTG